MKTLIKSAELSNGKEKKIYFKDKIINTVSFGEGKPLFLIPGWPFSSKIYLALEPFLSKTFQVTSFDFPGWSGNSLYRKENKKIDVDSHLKIAEELFYKVYGDEKRVDIGGVSIGGTLALLMAAKKSAKIGKTFAIYAPLNGFKVRQLHQLEVGLMNIAFRLPVFGYILKCYYALDKSRALKVGEDFAKIIRADYKHLDPKVVLGFALDFLNHNYLETISEVKNRVVLVGGGDDSAVPDDLVKEVSEVLPRDKYIELKKESHYTLALHPEKLAKIFLES